MIPTREKIRGLFLGTFIGDTMGMPAETMTPQQVSDTYGILSSYFSQNMKPHWDGDPIPAGCYTDDTQLSLAVARGLTNGLDMDAQVATHLEAFETSTAGWGRTTRKALANLKNGISWTESGLPSISNGVLMKLGPLAAYKFLHPKEPIGAFLRKLTEMTHKSDEVNAAAIIHMQVLLKALRSKPADYMPSLSTTIAAASIGSCPISTHLKKTLSLALHPNKQSILELGLSGSERFTCKASMALSYYCLIRYGINPNTIPLVIGCGGDTDTNAALVGGIIGAVHGENIFPKAWVQGLNQTQLEEVLSTAESLIQINS